jgi:PAS domain S-box-containing protein
LERLLDSITAKTLELLKCEATGIYIYDEVKGGLVFRRALHLDPELAQELVLKPGEGIAGRAFQERRPHWTADRLADPSLQYTPGTDALIREKAPRAYLAAPIVSRGRVHGVLMDYFFGPHEYTSREIELLSTLAAQAAIAMENTRLYHETVAQKTQLTQIFDSTSDGIILVGTHGRIEAANRRAGELLGVASQNIVGLGLADLVSGHFDAVSEYGRAVTAFKLSLLEDQNGIKEGDLVLPSARRVLHWTAQPTRDSAGYPVGLTLTFRDVTREREADQMKTDFVSFATHQLRTPLAGIKWMLELAAQEPGLPEEAGSFIQDARASADRLIGLVNDLLDVSRLERGKITFAPQAIRLEELTRSVLEEVNLLIQEKRHRLSVSGGEELPPVVADPQLLRQVLLNLVSNAIKYTLPGGEIAIHMTREGEAVQWAIRDSGVGIPKAAQARLFEKFYRADNVVTIETEGTGLGLYLVRLIVERCGGKIWCDSEEGHGSTFSFTLPLNAK